MFIKKEFEGITVQVFEEKYREAVNEFKLSERQQIYSSLPKTVLDDALNDERFVEQFSKYNDAIKNSNFNGDYLLCISIGGDEKNLLPPGFLEEDTGNKRSRLYTLLYNEGNRIPLISAAAIWCLSTLYIKEKVDDISTKLIQLFNDQSNIALLSCGIIKYINGSYEIISLKDALK